MRHETPSERLGVMYDEYVKMAKAADEKIIEKWLWSDWLNARYKLMDKK